VICKRDKINVEKISKIKIIAIQTYHPTYQIKFKKIKA